MTGEIAIAMEAADFQKDVSTEKFYGTSNSQVVVSFSRVAGVSSSINIVVVIIFSGLGVPVLAEVGMRVCRAG